MTVIHTKTPMHTVNGIKPGACKSIAALSTINYAEGTAGSGIFVTHCAGTPKEHTHQVSASKEAFKGYKVKGCARLVTDEPGMISSNDRPALERAAKEAGAAVLNSVN